MRTWPALDVGWPQDGVDAASDAAPLPDLLQAALLDHAVAAVDETAEQTWRVYFHDQAARDDAAAALRATFPQLALDAVDVADEDWAARSQAGLRAVAVGRLVVAPPWDVPGDPGGTLVIVIQPSTGFGTGHHATTRRCLAALQHSDVPGARVLDIGTGSGVLAIAASLLGAADVHGIDDDPDAVQAAAENLALNPAARVKLTVGDFRADALLPADVVLANLTGGLLQAAAARLERLVLPGGRLILSGFTPADESRVGAAFARCRLDAVSEEQGWLCFELHRRAWD